jgi:haloacetate dehalogenase
MFEGFDDTTIDTGETTVRVRRCGSGPPLLLLHGNPQTHVMWHLVAPRLAEEFTVVATDLRGYGDSGKPPTTPDHEPYSKRAMARDQVAVMRALGFERFLLAGHDRGGRVAYRLALDHPERVEKLAVLDIIPTGEMFRRMDYKLALQVWHWLFLAQPQPIPENVIGWNPEGYFGRSNDRIYTPEARAEYLRCFLNPEVVHAICEDYRAGATFDMQLDEADRGTHKITCPVLAIWGTRGAIRSFPDVLGIWREWADDVRGRAIESGHFLPEEAPGETYRELRAFFRS